VVAGPAVVHTGSRDYLSHMIRHGFVNVLFGGNALATHDIEQSLYGTSLGISMTSGGSTDEGHEHHLRSINRIRAVGAMDRELLDLAAHHGILIVEDSPYRMVSPGPHLPALKSLDRHRRVIHLGSFAKTAFPGARVGFAVADQPVTDAAGHTGLLADELAKIKSMVTVNTPALSQAVIAGMLLACDGRISELNTQQAAYYARAMRSTLRQLDLRFPSPKRGALGVRWNEPDGGFFLTIRVPFHADNAALARSAEDFGVIWTPMSYFYPQGGGECSLRLSVSYLSEEDIANGIARLASFIEAERKVN